MCRCCFPAASRLFDDAVCRFGRHLLISLETLHETSVTVRHRMQVCREEMQLGLRDFGPHMTEAIGIRFGPQNMPAPD